MIAGLSDWKGEAGNWVSRDLGGTDWGMGNRNGTERRRIILKIIVELKSAGHSPFLDE